VPARLAGLEARLQSVLSDLQALMAECTTKQAVTANPGEEYLSLNKLCARIPYKDQTIRNLIGQGVLRNGEHFVQRKRHGKVVFVWSAMQQWLRERQQRKLAVEPFTPAHHARTRKVR
jgi:hypothetical protein